jgi:hypothetical protein
MVPLLQGHCSQRLRRLKQTQKKTCSEGNTRTILYIYIYIYFFFFFEAESYCVVLIGPHLRDHFGSASLGLKAQPASKTILLAFERENRRAGQLRSLGG